MIRTLPRRLTLALSCALFAAAAGAQTASTTTAAPQAGFFAHMLQKLDTDGDGRISEAEWLAAATARFKAIDTQNAGSFSAATLASSPAATPKAMTKVRSKSSSSGVAARPVSCGSRPPIRTTLWIVRSGMRRA